MRLARNVSAGMVSSGWTAALGIGVVPFYLKLLGVESYGLIGFFATAQALFQLFDLGMAPTINRQVARDAAGFKMDGVRSLLRSLEIIYWSVAAFILLLMLLLAPAIGAHWLNATTIPTATVTHAVMLMGLVVACRWPAGLYQGTLNGLQRITLSSGVTIVTATFGSLGAIVVLAFVSRTIEAFFLWQAAVGLVSAITLRTMTWRAVGGRMAARFDATLLKSIWRFSMSMMALTISALAFSQLDRVLLSKLLTLEAFGQYVLAGVVASALTLLTMPFYNAIYPRFSAMCASGENAALYELYKFSGRLLATVLFCTALVIALAGQDLIAVWTGNPQLASKVAPLATLLAIGTAVHGVMYIPHALQLAQGKAFIPLVVNSVLLLIMVPTIIAFVYYFGALGGAAAWLLLHILYVLLAGWMMARFVGHKTGGTWLLNDVGTPLVICSAVGLVAHALLPGVSTVHYIRIIFTLCAALAALGLTFMLSPLMRHRVLNAFRAEFGSLRRRGAPSNV